MMSVDFTPVIRSDYYAKIVNPEIITVIGGQHPSIVPEEVIKYKFVDNVIKELML